MEETTTNEHTIATVPVSRAGLAMFCRTSIETLQGVEHAVFAGAWLLKTDHLYTVAFNPSWLEGIDPGTKIEVLWVQGGQGKSSTLSSKHADYRLALRVEVLDKNETAQERNRRHSKAAADTPTLLMTYRDYIDAVQKGAAAAKNDVSEETRAEWTQTSSKLSKGDKEAWGSVADVAKGLFEASFIPGHIMAASVEKPTQYETYSIKSTLVVGDADTAFEGTSLLERLVYRVQGDLLAQAEHCCKASLPAGTFVNEKISLALLQEAMTKLSGPPNFLWLDSESSRAIDWNLEWRPYFDSADRNGFFRSGLLGWVCGAAIYSEEYRYTTLRSLEPHEWACFSKSPLQVWWDWEPLSIDKYIRPARVVLQLNLHIAKTPTD